MSPLLRQLPQTEILLSSPLIREMVEKKGRPAVTQALRTCLGALRAQILSGKETSLPDFGSEAFAGWVAGEIAAAEGPAPRALINATGILIHTNLGRARLAPEAIAAAGKAGGGAINLEFDLATGRRGDRYAWVEHLLCTLTGAQAALVVNNCAAAILLSLMATAQGRKVVASRGELIEIGGGYRLPDVIAESGAVLKEVGSTNRTYISDYEEGADEDTAVLLKSHTSNYRITGFTAAPARAELAALARKKAIWLIEDLGSGALVDLSPFGLSNEPVIRDVLAAGVDLVLFSGDKLLGGPQCGILAGKQALISALRRHPLCRAVRADKLSLAALEATLRLYLPPNDPFLSVPVLAAIARPAEELEETARKLAAALSARGLADVRVEASEAYVGGGAMPEGALASFAVSIGPGAAGPDDLAARLRMSEPGLVGRVEQGRFLIDMRSLAPGEEGLIPDLFARLAGP